MTNAGIEDPCAARVIALEEVERFRTIRQLHNHWARPRSEPGYYWYLTFGRKSFDGKGSLRLVDL